MLYSRQDFLLQLFGLAAFSRAIGQTPQRPSRMVEESVKGVNPGDVGSFERHAQLVLMAPHTFQIPDEVVGAAALRFARGEMACRSGEHRGVSEDQLITLFNQDVRLLGAPTFTGIDKDQVQYLRGRLSHLSPTFMSSGASGSSRGASLGSPLSPLQAVHLSFTMADQKLLNPLFQFGPGAWKGNFQAAKAAKDAQLRLRSPGGVGVRTASLTAKGLSLRQQVNDSVSKMSVPSLVSLANHHLSAIGI